MEEQRREAPPACIRRISAGFFENRDSERGFLRQFGDQESYAYYKVFRGMTELKRFKVSNQKKGNGGAKRGKIQKFTPQARNRFIKTLLQAPRKPDWWIDHTFEDSVFKDMNLEKRVKESSRVFKRFKERLRVKYPDIWYIIKREYEPRKSGDLIGELVPHFHGFYWFDCGLDQVLEIQKMWVECTGTKDAEKALSVAFNEKSYREIESEKMAYKYASKYVAKLEEHETDVSLGRFWFKKMPEPECDLIILDRSQDKKIRRHLRVYAKGASKKYKKSLKWSESTFVIMNEETLWRMFEWVNHTEDFILEDEECCF